jgi:anaerobic magnesium-protoporphyrin IX monomethyl ester cyclase
MKQAGCERIFFGIESGNDSVLKIMNKQFTTDQARAAVESVASTGIETGAFFILGYPGETDQTVLDTVSFAASLPLDYASFTMPYPIPGTGLYEKVRKSVKDPMYTVPKSRLIDHSLNFESYFSETKLKFAILKAAAQIRMRKHLPNTAYTIIGKPFEALTDLVFKALK